MTRRSRINWILLIQSFILSSPWLIKLGTRDFQFCIFCAKFQKAWNFSWVPDKTRNFSEFRKAHSNLIILLRSCPLENITEQTTSAVMETYSAMLFSEFPTVLALNNLELVCFSWYIEIVLFIILPVWLLLVLFLFLATSFLAAEIDPKILSICIFLGF